MTDRIVSVGDDLTIPAGVIVPVDRVDGLGTAATADADDFATSSQGAKADAADTALAGRLSEASLSSTYAAKSAIGGLLPAPLVGVEVATAGTTPIALDVWGGYTWGAYGSSIYRSSDEGDSWELYTSTYPAGKTLARIMPTSDGEVMVCDAATLYKSSGWASGTPTWVLKATAAGTCQFLAWGFDGDSAGAKFISTEYSSATRADSRYVRMSLDSGDTWNIVYDSVAVHGATLANGSHLHGCCYDEWADRWYISEGHDDGGASGDIAGIYCSTDDGATWARAAKMVFNPAPTVVVATVDGLVLASDGSIPGLFGVLRRTDPALEELVNTYRWRTGRAGVIGFGRRGFRQPGTDVVYVSFATGYSDVAPIIAAGTATSGALAYTWTGTYAANDIINHPVMPSTHRMLAYAYMNGGANRQIITALAAPPGARSVTTVDTGGAVGGTANIGDSLALGPQSTTGDASRSVAVGVGAVASTTQDCTSVGNAASASTQGTAVGSGAVAHSYGVAIGKGATTGTNTEGTAIGTGAANTSTGAVAVGRSSSAGNASTAVGQLAVASGSGALALGYGAQATHTRSVVLRDASTAPYQIQGGARHVELTEVASAPGAGAANSARLYVRDDGSGKTQLVVIFATGAVQVLATEP